MSIYYFKNDFKSQSLLINDLNQSTSISSPSSTAVFVSSSATTSTKELADNLANLTAVNNPQALIVESSSLSSNVASGSIQIANTSSNSSTPNPTTIKQVQSSLFIPQKNESFNDKLKLWKCCTLIKQQNITLEKILNRIKNER